MIRIVNKNNTNNANVYMEEGKGTVMTSKKVLRKFILNDNETSLI